MRIPSVIVLSAVLIAEGAVATPGARAGDVSGTVTFATGGSSQNQDPSRTVIYLDAHPALPADVPREDQRPQIAQQGKAFSPDLSVMVQGTTMEFPNWDPFSHNVFSRSRAASFDLDRYGQGQSKSYVFNNVGVVQLFCNIHPQMKAVVLVVPNTCFARADTRGRFSIPDVPPGRFVLVGWHERAAEDRQTIDVTRDGLRGLVVTMSAESARDTAAVSTRRPGSAPGVERGLGVKRERLNLPVVDGAHPAPNSQRNN